jgi:hypothetical protein
MTHLPMTGIWMMMLKVKASTLRRMLLSPSGMNVSAKITWHNHDQSAPSDDKQGLTNPYNQALRYLDSWSNHPSTLIFINL